MLAYNLMLHIALVGCDASLGVGIWQLARGRVLPGV
jgi:hypothetical protein